MAPRFFATPAAFRSWLERRHAEEGELLVGFYKTSSGRKSITWPESVDEALCFGWIDGVRRGIDAEDYSIRFTPRRKRSIWSAVNIKRAGELIELDGCSPPDWPRSRRAPRPFSRLFARAAPGGEARARAGAAVQAQTASWEWFQAQAPSYRRAALHWATARNAPRHVSGGSPR